MHGRERVLLSGPWRFLGSQDLQGAEAPAFDDSRWAQVTTPHTWSQGGEPQAYRAAWYRLRFDAAPDDSRRTYLLFEGADTIADVWLNGAHLGQHRGAFTRFSFDATPHLRRGTNVLAVRLNNRLEDCPDCLPSGTGKQLYHLYGGLYRKVWLLDTERVHLDPLDLASTGVYVTTRNVTREGAEIEVRSRVRNGGPVEEEATVVQRLLDGEREVWSATGSARVKGGEVAEVKVAGRLERPRLWDLKDPHLYRLETAVLVGRTTFDELSTRIGFRDFRYVKPGFTLNGEPILLRGTNKHQETEKSRHAVSDDELREDFRMLKELGVNNLRLAHYPHAELEYDLADELGLLVIAENGHSNVSKSEGTGDLITREMVRQNYNHPSIVVWSVGNEAAYKRVDRYAAIVREEDPERAITYASNSGGRPDKRDLTFIAQNMYRGWYRGEPWEFEALALRMKYVAENGGGSVITNHTDYAEAHHVLDRFEPEEYRQHLAEIHAQVVFRDHPQEVPLYNVWVFRDFGIDKYKGRNTKGFLTAAGFPKDHFYLFQSFLRPDHPVVHLASKTFFLRRGSATNGFKAYSNAKSLRLFLNGRDQGERRNGEFRHPNGRRIDNVFFWGSRMAAGRNEVRVTDGAGHEDTAVVYFQGPDGGPPAPADTEVQELRSGNPRNPAYFVDAPVREQWPFYWEIDGSADNTFDLLPEAVRGASWIATRRTSKPGLATELSFRLRRAADVFVMFTQDAAHLARLRAAGFEDAGPAGVWRGDDLKLVGAHLARRRAAADERLVVPAADVDAVVLVKEQAAK